MKQKIIFGLLVLSLLLNGGLIYKFILSGETLTIADQRTAILLTEEESNLVRAEMRAFLGSVESMTLALNRGDMATVAESARSVGRAAAQAVPGSLMGKLPIEFKRLGLATHSAFDQLALDAEQMEDSALAQEQLGKLLGNCVACHAAFQVRVAPSGQ